MSDGRQYVQASILDRLVDREPDVVHEPPQAGSSIGKVKDCVARDLENLLNTRRSIRVPSDLYREVRSSLFVYGLPDFTSRNPGNVMVRTQLRLEIEKTVACFEPRLKNITVTVDAPAGGKRELRFRITAVLVVAAISEQVVFDTNYDLTTNRYIIER